MKVATFYPKWKQGDAEVMHGYDETLIALLRGHDVHTTQMCLINEAKDYDAIRICESYLPVREPLPHHCDRDVVVISNNHDGTYSCDRSEKGLRRTHNLFKLWEAGEFDW